MRALRTASLMGVVLAMGWASSQTRAWGQAGSKAWDYPAGVAIMSSPALGIDGTIYVGTSDGRLLALSPSGALRWQYQARSALLSAPSVGRDETVYVAGEDGRVYALNSAGLKRWDYRTGGPIYGGVALGTDDTVYAGSQDGKLTAIGTSGLMKWTYATGGALMGSPILGTDGTIFIGNRLGMFEALKPEGTRRWVSNLGESVEATSAAIGVDGAIYVGTLGGRFLALSEGTGKVLWTVEVHGRVYSAPAVATDGTVYVTSQAGWAYAFRPDGTERWRRQFGAEFGRSSLALAADGTLHVGTMAGQLLALGPDGSDRWTFTSAGPINLSSPVLGTDPVVYVGSEDGKLYALRTSAGGATAAWPMAHRDPRHSGGGFVDRRLPAAYSAGMERDVVLEATPAAGVTYYTVEDSPPAGWQVVGVDNGGWYDATSRRVRFGPFLDGISRELTYRVVPPLSESGQKFFSGSSSVHGVARMMGGVHALGSVLLHPADLRPVDTWMTLAEVTAYGTAWKRGAAWSTGPSPVPTAYLARAIQLWQRGEDYRYTTNFTTAPEWWTNPADPAHTRPQPEAPDVGTATNGTAFAQAPLLYHPGEALTVQLYTAPATNVAAYAVEECPPAGWSVLEVGNGGLNDPVRGKVKWGPFFDATPRWLTYRVMPPAGATGQAEFAGWAAFDGVLGKVTGQRVLQPADSGLPDPFVVRDLPEVYYPATPLEVQLETAPLTHQTYYVVEDSPPPGWTVGEVSHGGYFDPTHQVVRFGPFLDGLARTLTYEATPPLDQTGAQVFQGLFLIGDATGVVAGDAEMDSAVLHPADGQYPDGWLTVAEVTAYGAAWKRGAPWSVEPTPIPPGYLTRAIELWLGGEYYGMDENLTEPPGWWVNLLETPPAGLPNLPPTPPKSTNSTARVSMPRLFTNDVPFEVSLVVTPAKSVAVYGVEVQLPMGWTLTPEGMTEGGRFDPLRNKVKWGPFFDAEKRTLSYAAVASPEAESIAQFEGHTAFDGAWTDVLGRRTAYRNDAELAPVMVSVALKAGGAEVVFDALKGEIYELQGSVDLEDWGKLGTVTNLTGRSKYLDTGATNRSARFYRVLWP